MIKSSENNFSGPKKSRRDAIKLMMGVGGAGLILASEPNLVSVQAAPLIQFEDRTPWNVIPFRKDRWFPLDPNSAAGPSLEENVLVYFDKQNQTATAPEYRAWADQRIINNPASPGVMASYGECHGASAAALRVAEAQAEGAITEEQAHVIMNDEILFGLMVGRHMDDIQDRLNPFNTAESIAHFLSRLRSPAVIPGIVQVRNGLDGAWYYPAHGYRGSSILVSGFGISNLEVAPENIVRAFYPISRQEAPANVNPSLRLETRYLSEWKKGYTNQRVDQLLGFKG